MTTTHSIPLFKNRLPIVDEAIDLVVREIDRAIEARVQIACFIIDNDGKPLTEINGLNALLGKEMVNDLSYPLD